MRGLILSLIITAAGCQAATIFTAFSTDTLSGNPGDTLSFFGTLTNSTASTVFVNGDSFTFAIPGAADDTPFLLNAPLSLGANVSFGPFEFIDVTIPFAQPPGIFDGTFTVQGGDDSCDPGHTCPTDDLGTVAFHVVVNAQAVPEPATGGLVGAVLAIAGVFRSRLRRSFFLRSVRSPVCLDRGQ